MKRFWAWLTGQKIVYMQDHDGAVHRVLAYKTSRGWVAKRYAYHIRDVLLLPDGTTERSERHYVMKWWE